MINARISRFISFLTKCSTGFLEKEVIDEYYYNDGIYEPAVVYEWTTQN